jgi:hypothetical protein
MSANACTKIAKDSSVVLFSALELVRNWRAGVTFCLEVSMHDILIAAVFIAMVVAPAFAALSVFQEKNSL